MNMYHHRLIPIVIAAIWSLSFYGCDKIQEYVHSLVKSEMEPQVTESPDQEQKFGDEEEPIEEEELPEEEEPEEEASDSDENAGTNPGDINIDDLKPKVRMKPPEVIGSIDKRIIQKIVRQHAGELRACYEKELHKNKELAGRIVVLWLISSQGVVTKALLKESTIKNKNVEDCVVNSIKFWRFPAPKGGGIAKVEFPFEFETTQE